MTRLPKYSKVLILLGCLGFLLVANTAMARAQEWNDLLKSISENSIGNTGEIKTVEDLAGIVINIALGIGIALSLIATILSGIKYMSSRGDVKAAMGAKQALTYSIVALLVTVGAFAIMGVIINVLGVENPDSIFLGPPPAHIPPGQPPNPVPF